MENLNTKLMDTMIEATAKAMVLHSKGANPPIEDLRHALGKIMIEEWQEFLQTLSGALAMSNAMALRTMNVYANAWGVKILRDYAFTRI